MAADEPTRKLSKPMLAIGGCVASLAWLMPIAGYLVWDVGPREDVVIWSIAWPFVYAGAVSFTLAINRMLDLKASAWVFGVPEGPAPRWAHMTVQVLTFVCLPSTVFLAMVGGIMEKLGG